MEFTKAEVDRFYSKVVKRESGCWEWSGAKFDSGYGMFCLSGRKRKTYATHRISWMIASGLDIPSGRWICHTCDNRLCVNPDHLYLGTPRDNNMDTVKRGRANRLVGSDCPWSKVTEAQVLEILASDYGHGECKRLAAKFGIHQSQVSHIRRGKRWPHMQLLLSNG